MHLIYNATASPAPRQNQTLSSGFTADTRQWTINTVPVISDNPCKPSAHLVIDSTLVNPYALEDIESILYGHKDKPPRLLTQNNVIESLGSTITEPLTEPI